MIYSPARGLHFEWQDEKSNAFVRTGVMSAMARLIPIPGRSRSAIYRLLSSASSSSSGDGIKPRSSPLADVVDRKNNSKPKVQFNINQSLPSSSDPRSGSSSSGSSSNSNSNDQSKPSIIMAEKGFKPRDRELVGDNCRVVGFGPRLFRINNTFVRQPVIVMQKSFLLWNVDYGNITLDSLMVVPMIFPTPEILLIGTGRQQRQCLGVLTIL
jgi:hypothetical protein